MWRDLMWRGNGRMLSHGAIDEATGLGGDASLVFTYFCTILANSDGASITGNTVCSFFKEIIIFNNILNIILKN